MMTGGGNHPGGIVVLGMHRSGTSCVGELLAAMGAYFGPPDIGTSGNVENPHGLFERRDLRHICHFILQQTRSEWWKTSAFSPGRLPDTGRARVDVLLAPMVADLSAHEPWFIKEPRLCVLLPMLQEKLGRIVAVCVWRDPLEVAESLRTRDAIPIEFGIALWERYVRASFATGVPSAIVSYSALTADPTGTTRKLLEVLARLGISRLRMPDADQLARVVDPSLRRSRPRHADAGGLLTPYQRRLLAALEAGDPGHPEFAVPMAPEQMKTLATMEEARRNQMSAAAYRSLAEARGTREPMSPQARFERILLALRYLPTNPVRWLKWSRCGLLRQRLQQHWKACSVAASGAFDAVWYARRYPDVAASRIDPVMHFVRFGAAEGRDPAPSLSTQAHLHAMLEASEVTVPPAATRLAKQH
jgi:hypothetical protein